MKELSIEIAGGSKHHENVGSDSDFLNENIEKQDDVFSDQVLTLAIHEKLSLQNGSTKPGSSGEIITEMSANHDILISKDHSEVMVHEVGSPESRGIDRKPGGKGSSVTSGSISFCFGPRGQENGTLKVKWVNSSC